MTKDGKSKNRKLAKDITKLPIELRSLIIDTKNYRIKTPSTKLLEDLRYKTT